jgi:NAD(P)H dehydrogenase (quinone)
VVLTGEGHENKTYELSGQVAWTLEDLASELTKITGKTINYRRLSRPDHFEQLVSSGLPAPVAEVFVDTYEGIASGQLSHATEDLAHLAGRPPTSLEQTIASMLGADPAPP